MALVEVVKAVAQRKNATPAQVALAWLLAQKPWIAPIPGTTKLHRLDENLASAQLELAPADIHAIQLALADIEIVGARYPAARAALVNR